MNINVSYLRQSLSSLSSLLNAICINDVGTDWGGNEDARKLLPHSHARSGTEYSRKVLTHSPLLGTLCLSLSLFASLSLFSSLVLFFSAGRK